MTGVEQIRKYTTAIEENERSRNVHMSAFISISETTVVKINKAGIKFSFNKSPIFTFTANRRSRLNSTKLKINTVLLPV